MTKQRLAEEVKKTKTETHDALQLVWDATNKGQRSKLLKNDKIRKLFERYEVITHET